MVGDLEIDLLRKTASRSGQAIELGPREYALLEHLALRRGEVVTRSEIEEHIYDGKADPMSNVIDSAICLLRKKPGATGAQPLIHTLRGMGYVLEVP